jgi:hypothetical protein
MGNKWDRRVYCMGNKSLILWGDLALNKTGDADFTQPNKGRIRPTSMKNPRINPEAPVYLKTPKLRDAPWLLWSSRPDSSSE